MHSFRDLHARSVGLTALAVLLTGCFGGGGGGGDDGGGGAVAALTGTVAVTPTTVSVGQQIDVTFAVTNNTASVIEDVTATALEVLENGSVSGISLSALTDGLGVIVRFRTRGAM